MSTGGGAPPVPTVFGSFTDSFWYCLGERFSSFFSDGFAAVDAAGVSLVVDFAVFFAAVASASAAPAAASVAGGAAVTA